MSRKQLGMALGLALCLGGLGCKQKDADLILTNGIVHTMDSVGTIGQAIAIKDGKVIAVGRSEDLLFEYATDSVWDLKGKPVFPGWIDGHCHFYGAAMNTTRANLVGSKSWEEAVALVDSFGRQHPDGWLIGRGWDQNDWAEKGFPDNTLLNALFADRPVLLQRIDGHAAIANQAALDLAEITPGLRISGGKIEVNSKGKLTGLLLDNAVDRVMAVVPAPSDDAIAKSLQQLEKTLFSYGLTTVSDAGLDLHIIQLIDSLQQQGLLRIRVYAMANPTEENFERFLSTGPYKTDQLTVSSFKVYADGALGSRGACLLQPYKDDPSESGFLLNTPTYFREIAARLYQAGFQMNTHCIGDSANRLLLRIYGEALGGPNDRRWRIEHAQVVSPEDMEQFKVYQIIPSVQPTHATSDMPWAEDRIGKDRLPGAYAYKSLLDAAGLISFGTDFPVERVNPMYTLFSAVQRTDTADFPRDGFLRTEAVSVDTALRAMTSWAAYANFEEHSKGSLQKGKFADLVVLDVDPYGYDPKQLYRLKVLYTAIAGKVVFDHEKD
jgi:predicted amidohydrolase YtcJ